MLTSGDRECGEETRGRAEGEAGEEAVRDGALGEVRRRVTDVGQRAIQEEGTARAKILIRST